MSAAQAAQQDNRDQGGRYTEKPQQDPGGSVLAGRPGQAHSREVKHQIGDWTIREFAARQLADEAVDEKQTLHVAGVCWDAAAAHPNACTIQCMLAGRADSGAWLELGDILDDAGDRVGEVPWTDSRIDLEAGTGQAAWLQAWDRDTCRIDIQHATRIAETRPKPKPLRPSIEEVRAQVEIFDNMGRESKVRWVRPGADGDITEGTLRGGVWTADGQIAPAGTDPRDGHVRVTTRSGMEMWVPFQEMVEASLGSELGWG